MSPSDNIDAGLQSEATRILFQAHREYIVPKVEVAVVSINAALATYPKIKALGEPSVRLLIQPDRNSSFIEYPCTDYSASSEQSASNRLNLTQRVLTKAWEKNHSPGSAYLLPVEASPEPILALALVIGDQGQNQQFSGSLLLVWPGEQIVHALPFEPPLFEAPLPVIEGCQLLHLPPRFENSRTPPEWIGIAQTIKKLPQWRDLEKEVTKIAALGEPIVEQLVPILADAAWRSMAERVMHELSRTAAMPQPMLIQSRKALDSALSTLRRANLPDHQALIDKLSRNVATIDENLRELKNDQDYVESKVRWFYYLVAGQLKTKAQEAATFTEVLRTAIEALGCDLEDDCIIENPTHPLWAARLRLPRLFPQHCIEAFVSNAFLRRDTSQPVRFKADTLGDDCLLEWSNIADAENAGQLKEELQKRSEARTFGLRMTSAISERFFKHPIEIRVEPLEEGELVHHRLRIPGDLILPASAKPETNVRAPVDEAKTAQA